MTKDELIARLEGLTGPDRDTDAEIVAHLGSMRMLNYPPTDDFGPRNKWQFWSEDGKHFLGNKAKFPVPLYTASLDAAIALAERQNVNIPTLLLDVVRSWIESNDPTSALPRHVCIAILRAHSQ